MTELGRWFNRGENRHMDFRISLSTSDFAKLVAGEVVTIRVDCQKIDILLQEMPSRKLTDSGPQSYAQSS